MKTPPLAVVLVTVPLLAARAASAEPAVETAAQETRGAVEAAGRQATAVRDQAAAPVASARDRATSRINAARDPMKDKLKSPFKLPKFDVPDAARAAKIRRASVDDQVSSPRTLTYKSRASRLSRWIAPLTMGLITYVPFDTMNAGVTGRVNNLMAQEKVSVESMAAAAFARQLKDGKRWSGSGPAGGEFKIQINRYALDPVPTSLSLLRPTVSLTGRLYDNSGKLLWVGKGFTSSLEPGIRGATLEQYEANPEVLREDFETAVQTATKRLASQANAVPQASVKVLPAE